MNSNSSGIVNSKVLLPQNLPVGWRFHPTDEELVGHYLKRKRRGEPIDDLDIGEVQLCNHDPWDLPDLSKNKSSGDKIWYFFCLREYHKNSGLAKRKTPAGYWKCTGDIRLVISEESDEEIGTKRTLVFQNPDATQWVIHEYEYTAELNSPLQGNFVLCKLKIKSNKKKRVIKKTKKAEPDCKNARPNRRARKGESDCNMVSASAPVLESSTLKGLIANLAYGDGETSNYMVSDVDNQNSSKTSISTCNKGETRYPVASDLENHNPNDMAPMSSYMKSTPSYLVTLDFENQNPGKSIDISASKEGKWSSLLEMPSDFDNQNHVMETDMPFPKDYLCPLMASNVGETTFQEVQSQHKGTDIPILEDCQGISMASSTQEGEEAMLKKAHNQYNKDMPILEDRHCWMVGEDTFPEINPQLVEELIAFYELEDCLNSAPQQPIHTNEIPGHSTSHASVSI